MKKTAYNLYAIVKFIILGKKRYNAIVINLTHKTYRDYRNECIALNVRPLTIATWSYLNEKI